MSICSFIPTISLLYAQSHDHEGCPRESEVELAVAECPAVALAVAERPVVAPAAVRHGCWALARPQHTVAGGRQRIRLAHVRQRATELRPAAERPASAQAAARRTRLRACEYRRI